MSADGPYVPTKAITEAVKGQETEILRALGINWDTKTKHISCPYPDHSDEDPSWRWNSARGRAHCTCTRSA